MPVSFVSQQNYERASLISSMRRAIELAGFDLERVRGKNVLLKPNLLGAYPIEMGVTTHPEFVRAAVQIFMKAGANVSIGDSPNGIYSIDDVWRVTGMSDVSRTTGAREARFEISGIAARGDVNIAREVVEADIVVNLPKFKTHGLTILTLAVKNLFGCVNGMQKTCIHRDYNSTELFADILVKIADAVKPSLTIIDGIVAMDGNGPSAGKLVDLGVIAAGTDIFALDAACCKLIGFAPAELDTLIAAKKVGLWNPDEKIELLGDPIDKLKPKKFNLPSTYTKDTRNLWITRFVIDRIWANLSAEPKINPNICKKCGMCMDACPFGAITQAPPDLFPMIRKKICTQCFCCHEICPHRAIDLKESLLLQFARWMAGRRKTPCFKKDHGTTDSWTA